MTILPNPLKAADRSDRLLGLWLTMGSEIAAEIASGAGVDWVLVDMEHTYLGEAEIVSMLRAVQVGGRAEPVVRVPWNEPVIMKRLLDSGVRSFLVPFVQNADEARRAVAATRYPPAGIRGFSGAHRSNDYGRDGDYRQKVNGDIFIAVQVESPEAIANAGAIAAVEGVDCVFVGPNDLAANMGVIGQLQRPEVRAAIQSVVAPVHAAGKLVGMLDFDVESARGWLDDGFQFVAIGSDVGLLVSGAADLLKAHR